MPTRYEFRHVTPGDLPLLARWRKTPAVARWWGEDAPAAEPEPADASVQGWIVSLLGRPFAYMQDYDIHAEAPHPLGHLPRGARGIDQYIGEPDLLGLGHGPGFIAQRMGALFADGIPAIGTDPHPGNVRAIAAYAKLGFRASGRVQDTVWGTVLPMACTPEGFTPPPLPRAVGNGQATRR